MTEDTAQVVARATKIAMSPSEAREQRRSFAYGNTNIENDRITRQMIEEADKKFEPKKPA